MTGFFICPGNEWENEHPGKLTALFDGINKVSLLSLIDQLLFITNKWVYCEHHNQEKNKGSHLYGCVDQCINHCFSSAT